MQLCFSSLCWRPPLYRCVLTPNNISHTFNCQLAQQRHFWGQLDVTSVGGPKLILKLRWYHRYLGPRYLKKLHTHTHKYPLGFLFFSCAAGESSDKIELHRKTWPNWYLYSSAQGCCAGMWKGSRCAGGFFWKEEQERRRDFLALCNPLGRIKVSEENIDVTFDLKCNK